MKNDKKLLPDVTNSFFEDTVMKGNFRKMETKEDIQNMINCLHGFGYNNIEIDKTIRIIRKHDEK